MKPDQCRRLLEDSGRRVRDGVQGRIAADRAMELEYSHPIHLIQLLIFHEGYHHGQIKLVLKAAGCPVADADVGPLTWGIWRAR